jgi:hypothetical protein
MMILKVRQGLKLQKNSKNPDLYQQVPSKGMSFSISWKDIKKASKHLIHSFGHPSLKIVSIGSTWRLVVLIHEEPT